jgi:hypothetical protein
VARLLCPPPPHSLPSVAIDLVMCLEQLWGNGVHGTRVHVEKPAVAQLVKGFPSLCGTRTVIHKISPVDPILKQLNAAHTTLCSILTSCYLYPYVRDL